MALQPGSTGTSVRRLRSVRPLSVERIQPRRRAAVQRSWIDAEIRRAHRRLKQSIPAFLREGSLKNLLTTPVIYSVAVPLVLLDIWVSVYQAICFPIYGIARVRRRSCFVIDRHKLAYLNTIEKAHCLYCSYANGVMVYVRAVVARTEQYWCPIKHGRPVRVPHDHYRYFVGYHDAEGYRRELARLRSMLAHEPTRPVTRARGRA